jgi:hypothetical protein
MSRINYRTRLIYLAHARTQSSRDLYYWMLEYSESHVAQEPSLSDARS